VAGLCVSAKAAQDNDASKHAFDIVSANATDQFEVLFFCFVFYIWITIVLFVSHYTISCDVMQILLNNDPTVYI